MSHLCSKWCVLLKAELLANLPLASSISMPAPPTLSSPFWIPGELISSHLCPYWLEHKVSIWAKYWIGVGSAKYGKWNRRNYQDQIIEGLVGHPEGFIVYPEGIKDLLKFIIHGLVAFWNWLMGTNCAYLFPFLCSVISHQNLKPIVVRVFTPKTLAKYNEPGPFIFPKADC